VGVLAVQPALGIDPLTRKRSNGVVEYTRFQK